MMVSSKSHTKTLSKSDSGPGEGLFCRRPPRVGLVRPEKYFGIRRGGREKKKKKLSHSLENFLKLLIELKKKKKSMAKIKHFLPQR